MRERRGGGVASEEEKKVASEENEASNEWQGNRARVTAVVAGLQYTSHGVLFIGAPRLGQEENAFYFDASSELLAKNITIL